ncbi:hypothetical protein KAR91_78215 [Candidatus Pacearchaeota archaeon]|nr:hypothetical protein [Candidatus Pacearchaeota archaeon]
MAKTIVANMERERDVGNLELGQVGRIEDFEMSNVECRTSEELVDGKDVFSGNGIDVPNGHDPADPEVSMEKLTMDNTKDSGFDGVAENL